MPQRRWSDRRDGDPVPAREAAEPAAASESAARMLALQRSAGNAAVARFMAAGSQQVSREDDGYQTGATAQDTDDSFLDESSEEEAETTLDPVDQLAAAVAARVEETGSAADPVPLPADSDTLREDGGTGGDAYTTTGGTTGYSTTSDPYSYRGEAEWEEDESEVSEDDPAPPPIVTAAASAPADVGSHYGYSVQPDEESSSISEDDPVEVPAAPPPGGASHYGYSVQPDEDSDSSSESSLSEDAPGFAYTLPPDAQGSASAPVAVPEVAYAAPPKKKGRARRALEAVAKPVRAAGKAIKKLGGRIKGAFKGKKGKKAKVTAAELLGDGYAGYAPYSAQPEAEVPAAAPPTKYAQQLRASGSASSSVQGLPLGAQADDVSFSEDAPAPTKYTNLAKMGMSADEEFDSADFLNNKLLATNQLAGDMRRHGLVPKGTNLNAIMADRNLVKAGLKQVWGWSDADIAKYFDFGTNRAKQSKVSYIRNEADLKKFVVHSGASLTYGDPPQPFDTGSMVSKASGPGFAIFVMDGDGNIYAGQHRVGLFHHSSFLAGRDVAAAGELKVTAGTVEVMTSKSGHYRPDAEKTWQAVKQMAALGVSFAGAEVRVWGDNNMTNVYGGADFLRRGPQATIVRTDGMF